MFFHRGLNGLTGLQWTHADLLSPVWTLLDAAWECGSFRRLDQTESTCHEYLFVLLFIFQSGTGLFHSSTAPLRTFCLHYGMWLAQFCKSAWGSCRSIFVIWIIVPLTWCLSLGVPFLHLEPSLPGSLSQLPGPYTGSRMPVCLLLRGVEHWAWLGAQWGLEPRKHLIGLICHLNFLLLLNYRYSCLPNLKLEVLKLPLLKNTQRAKLRSWGLLMFYSFDSEGS